MNLDAAAVISILKPGYAFKFVNMGLDVKDLDERWARDAADFVFEHVEEYGTPPTKEVLNGVLGLSHDEALFGLEAQGELGADPDWVFTEVVKRKMFRSVQGALGEVTNSLRANDPEAALKTIQDFADGHDFRTKTCEPTSIFDLADGVIDQYKSLLDGKMGVPMPWPTLNEITMGLWPGTATYFAARPGTGKTQVAVLIALHALDLGHKVLLVSPEMSKEEVAERYFLAWSKVSGTRAIQGTLSSFEMGTLQSKVDSSKGKTGVWVLDSSDRLTPENIEAAIDLVKPDIVAVDSIYMLPFKGDKRERTERAVDWIRTCSKDKSVAFAAFHQMNRTTTKDAKFGGGYDSGNIALSDQLLWDAHGLFIMEQSKDMKDDKRMRFHVGKVRRGVWDGNPVDVHWDFDKMSFEEIEVLGSGSRFDEEDERDEFDAYEDIFGKD